MENLYRTQTPTLVKDPDGCDFIDINPFFELINEDYDRDLNELVISVDETIKYILYTVSEDMSKNEILDYKSAIYNLYNIRDIFRNMIRFKKIHVKADQSTTQVPTLVKDPYGSDFIDIKPFFAKLNEIYNRDLHYLSDLVDDAIKCVSNTISAEMYDSEIVKFDDAIFTLYNIRDIFRAMISFKQ